MNYTYLPQSPWTSSPTVVMTTPYSSKKTHNILQNSRVSLLVHDWVASRPPTLASHVDQTHVNGADSHGSGTSVNGNSHARSPPPLQRSSLASLLVALNSSELSSVSVTMYGTASLVPLGTDEERWFKTRHLANNTFGEEEVNGEHDNDPEVKGTNLATRTLSHESGDGGRSCFIAGEENRVILVKIQSGKVADWKGEVRDWYVEPTAGG